MSSHQADPNPPANSTSLAAEADTVYHAHAATGQAAKDKHHRGLHNPFSTHAADPEHPRRAAEIPGVLEGPVHKSRLLNDLDPRVKEHPGSATTGGHHTIPKVGATHHDHEHAHEHHINKA